MTRQHFLRNGGRLGQDGMVLLSTLLVLTAVSLLAVGMTGDTTTAMRIASNQKLIKQHFHLADGGADLGVHLLLDYLYPDAVDPDTDFPAYEDSVPLIDGFLTMTQFKTDENLLADIKGYPENDNDVDPDPDNLALYPYDVSFALTVDGGLPYEDARVTLDVDRLRAKYLVGSSIEFAAGYEGVGKGAGAGSVAVLYGIRAKAHVKNADGDPTPPMYSEVGTVYRKVSQVVGGGE